MPLHSVRMPPGSMTTTSIPKGFDLQPQAVADSFEGELRAVVPADQRGVDLPAHRGDVDDRPAAPGTHVWQDDLGQADGTEDVDVELAAGLVEAEDIDAGVLLVGPGLVAVQDGVVAVGEGALVLNAFARVLGGHALEVVDERLLAVADVRVVLDVGVADVATTHDQHERRITDSHQPRRPAGSKLEKAHLTCEARLGR